MSSIEIDSNSVSVLAAVRDGSIDGIKFCFNAGMLPNATDPDSETKNSLHCMCGLASMGTNPEVLAFLLRECVFKHEKVEDIIFKSAEAIVKANNPVMNQVLLDCTVEFFGTTKLPLDTFSARCMREYSQDAALAKNWDMLRILWEARDQFPIPMQYDDVEKKNIGKDKELLPALVTGAVFYDNLAMIEYAMNLPDKWEEYTRQCLGTWFRMAMEGHAYSVARYLFPLIKKNIITDSEYAATILKDSLRTGCYELHLDINQILIKLQGKPDSEEENTP